MCRAIPPLPQYVFMVWCLAKHRDNFTFYLYGKGEADRVPVFGKPAAVLRVRESGEVRVQNLHDWRSLENV
jgi:hypothetical protein